MRAIRDWFHKEPVLASQAVALLISTLTALVAKYFDADYTEEITLAVYILLSIIGVKVAREKVDGPETVEAKDRQYNNLDQLHTQQFSRRVQAEDLLRHLNTHPDERQANRQRVAEYFKQVQQTS